MPERTTPHSNDRLQRFDASDERGATMVEHALCLPLLLMLLIMAFEMMGFIFQAQTLQFTASSVLRDASVDPTLDVHSAVTNKLRSFAVGFGDGDQITYCPLSVFDSPTCRPGTILTGAPKQVMILQIVRRARTVAVPLLSRLDLQFEGQAIGKNEPE